MNYFALLVTKVSSPFYTTIFPSVYAFVFFNFLWCFNHFSFLFRPFPITRSQCSLHFAIFFLSLFVSTLYSCLVVPSISLFSPCMLSHFIRGINHIISSVLRFFHLFHILQSQFVCYFFLLLLLRISLSCLDSLNSVCFVICNPLHQTKR